MRKTKQINELKRRRTVRVRAKIKKAVHDHPRLSVFRAGKNIYAQVIDDRKGHTMAHASSLDKELEGKLKSGANKDAAAAVGKLVAQRALKVGIKEVVFDRGGYMFHGRVKALADAAREAGLAF